MTDHEHIERRLHDAASDLRVGTGLPSEVRRRITARRFSTVTVASLVTISVIAAGTFVARSVSSSSIPPAGGSPYSVDVPAEVWVMTEDGFLADPSLNLSWGRDSEQAETLACVTGLPPETTRAELAHEETGDVLSWDKNFVSKGDMATVCSHDLEAEVLVGIANDPSAHRLVIDGELEVHLVRTETTPMVEPTEVDCSPAVGFEPSYLPRGWIPELQEGAALGKDPYDNIAGHYGAEGSPGDHRKMDAGFIDLVALNFRFEPPNDGDLVVLGQPAEFDDENGTIEFGSDGCAYVLVGAGVGREELVPFAEGLWVKERSEEPAATGVVLGAGGLGIVQFGDEPDDVIDQLTQEFGPPDQDTGYTPAFSVFGTCPGEEVRGVGWGSLLVLFSDGDTGFGSEGTFHFFSYRDQLFDIEGRPVESLGLTTAKGVGLGSTVKDLRSAYGGDLTIRRRSLPGRIDRFFFETGGGSLGGTLARRTNSVQAFLGGAGCGE